MSKSISGAGKVVRPSAWRAFQQASRRNRRWIARPGPITSRIYRRAILEALDEAGRAWRLAYNSPSRDVLRMAVETGLVVTVLPDSLVGRGLRRLGDKDGLPSLPDMEILLYERPDSTDRSLHTLADVIAGVLAEPEPLAA